MQRAHKVALDPTNKQASGLARAAGCARFAYNWALRRWGEQYAMSTYPELGQTPRTSQYGLRRELNAIKRKQFPWMLESTKCAPQEAIIALGVAFGNFFAGRAKYPTPKKKGVHDSFRLSSGQFKIEGRRIRVPNVGWVRMREAVRFTDAKQVSVTISRRADRWFASVQCEIDDPAPAVRAGLLDTVGVDVGVREFVVSDGARHEVPRALRNRQRQLRRAQQALSRSQRGSENRAKARLKVAKLHARVADARSDWLHKLTTDLVTGHDRIVIEDLNVAGMVKNRRLAVSVTDASFGEFRRQLEYKSKTHGVELTITDRWFPSSKTCSACGERTNLRMTLDVRTWACEHCGVAHDRDLNAAKNLATYTSAGSSPVAACGAFLTATPPQPDGPGGARRRDEAGTEHH